MVLSTRKQHRTKVEKTIFDKPIHTAPQHIGGD